VIYRQRRRSFLYHQRQRARRLGDRPQRAAGELPLALIFSLLMTGIAWLATAGRMSFSGKLISALPPASSRFGASRCRMRTRQCCGVEILLRWNNPRRGAISPEVFIPIAEGYNLIVPLTRYVIAETARN
jgi:sensor c-di-GMP phosphodiesterase-like protein